MLQLRGVLSPRVFVSAEQRSALSYSAIPDIVLLYRILLSGVATVEIPAQVRFPTTTEPGRHASEQVIEEIADLCTDLDALNLQPLWTQNARLLSKVPRPSALPWLWRHGALRRLADRSKDLITISRGGDRRVMAMANPGLRGKPFATPTLWAAIRYLGCRSSTSPPSPGQACFRPSGAMRTESPRGAAPPPVGRSAVRCSSSTAVAESRSSTA